MKPKKEMTQAEIIEQINILEDSLPHVKGTKCEVYARIVGYYSVVNKNWNAGKQEEFKQRAMFDESVNPRKLLPRITESTARYIEKLMRKYGMSWINTYEHIKILDNLFLRRV